MTHEERVYHHTYETCEGIAEHAERIALLEELAIYMLSELQGVVSEGDFDSPSGHYFLTRRDVAAYEDRLRKLGVEVDG